MRFLLLAVLLIPVVARPALLLQPCSTEAAICGAVSRPLDPTGQVPGTIDITFEMFPARDTSQPVAGTIVAVEGGPGYATLGSAQGYFGLFYPLLANHNLLLVDNRGTGQSSPIRCEPLQSQSIQTVASVGFCGAQLGTASDLYGTELATDDLAAVLQSLNTGPVDLYGDSYGTWFSQAFALDHPELVRAVILDSAYPVLGEDPFYPFSGIFNRANYNLVCERSLSCQNLSGTSQDRIDALVAALRANPFIGQAYDGDGTLRTVTANPTAVAYTQYAGTMGEVIYRELDAAARAYADGDNVPLLRLFAENDYTSGFDQSGGPAVEYSRGLFAAVSCSDYPQLYDVTAPPAVRVVQEQNAIARELAINPGIYAPYTIDEFRQMSIDVSVLDLCLNWPVPSAAYPPQHSVPPHAIFPQVPVLVLSGSLDTLTTPAEGLLTANLFPHSQQVLIENSFHVTAVDDPDHCTSTLARNFFLNLNPGDTSCAANITEVRTVPAFALTVSGVPAALPSPGNQATPQDLQVAADATAAAGDVVARWWVNYSGSGVGLRGGTFTYSTVADHDLFTLDAIQWTTDVAVSGTIDWNYNTGSVTAQLAVSGPGSGTGTLLAQWMDREPHSMATITGQIDGRALVATMYAP